MLVGWDATLLDTVIELKILEIPDEGTELETTSLLLVETLTETVVDCRTSLLDNDELVTAKVSMEVLGTGVGDKGIVSLLEISIKELLKIETLVVCRMSLLTRFDEVPNDGVGVTIISEVLDAEIVEAPTETLVLTTRDDATLSLGTVVICRAVVICRTEDELCTEDSIAVDVEIIWSSSEDTMVGKRIAELLIPLTVVLLDRVVAVLLILFIMLLSIEVLLIVLVVVGPAITDTVEAKLLDTVVVLVVDIAGDDAITDDVIASDKLVLSTGAMDEELDNDRLGVNILILSDDKTTTELDNSDEVFNDPALGEEVGNNLVVE